MQLPLGVISLRPHFFRMMSCGMIAPRSGGQASLWQFRVEFKNGASPTLKSMQQSRNVFNRRGRTGSWLRSPNYATRKTCWPNKNQTSDLDDTERREVTVRSALKNSFAPSGLELILFVDPGRRSFQFACPGLSSFGLSALSGWAFPRRLASLEWA